MLPEIYFQAVQPASWVRSRQVGLAIKPLDVPRVPSGECR